MNELLINQVKEKLEKEKTEIKDRKAEVIAEPTLNALLEFCRQEEEFAQAIMESSKNFSECCVNVVKGTGNAVSDLEVYRKAVQFYFDGADIRFEMKIDLCASVNGITGKESLNISLMDLI